MSPRRIFDARTVFNTVSQAYWRQRECLGVLWRKKGVGGGGGKESLRKERYHKTLQHHAIPCGLALIDIIP